MAFEKNIKLKVTADVGQPEQQFDGVEVSVKELQERISYLNTEMRKMETQFGKSGIASKEYAMYQREAKLATEQLIRTQDVQAVSTNKSAR